MLKIVFVSQSKAKTKVESVLKMKYKKLTIFKTDKRKNKTYLKKVIKMVGDHTSK